MEELLIVMVMGLMLAGLVSFILCIVALSKISNLRNAHSKTAKEVDIRLRELEKKLTQLGKPESLNVQPSTSPQAKASTAPGEAHRPPVFAPPVPAHKPTPTVRHPAKDPQAVQPAAAKTPPPFPKAAPAQPQPPVQGSPVGMPTSTSSVPPSQAGPKQPDKKGLDLEQWLGIRGAAVLGGIVLALAGVYLFKYSIEKNLLSPPLRVALGLLTGLGCLFGSSVLRKRQFHLPANGLIGGGIVTLYGSVWAAHSLYELIHPFLAFLLMAAITVACGLLSMRHQSRFIAMLGLFGGFATPIMVSTGEVRTFELFGYLFLLNIGILALAKKLGQPLLAFVSLAATTAYQLLFLSQHLVDAGPETLLIIFGVFGILYLLTGLFFDKQDQRWAQVRTWGSILTLAMVGLLAFQDANLALLPTVLILTCLSAGACWIAYIQEDALLVKVAGIGTITCLWVWALANASNPEPPLLIAGSVGGLVFIYSLFLHFADRGVQTTAGLKGFQFAMLATAIGGLALLIHKSLNTPYTSFWVWLVSWLFICLLVWWHTRLGRLPSANLFFGTGLGVSLALYHLDHVGIQERLPMTAILLIQIGIGIALLALPRTLPDSTSKRWASRGACLYALILLAGFALIPVSGLTPILIATLYLALAFLAILGAFQCNNTWMYASVLLVGSVAFAGFAIETKATQSWYIAYLGFIVFATLLALAPFTTFQSMRTKRWTWVIAALAPAVTHLWLWPIFENRFSHSWEWVTSFTLALLALVGAFICHQNLKNGETTFQFGRTWFAGVAIALITLGLAIQFERSTLTLAFTLESLLLLGLWRRHLHPGFKFTAFAIFAIVFFRLAANPFIFDYGSGSTARIFSWLMPTYLLPCLGFLWGSLTLRSNEVAALSENELRLYPKKAPILSHLMAFGVIIIMFVYLNLAVVQYFGNGSLQLSFARQSARDLTLSLVWAVYGLTLMTLGIRQKAVALRRISLGMVILTICKVFLYDLGELTDLYRAASLFGLALSLLGVSVAYQKFVAGGEKKDPEPEEVQQVQNPEP